MNRVNIDLQKRYIGKIFRLNVERGYGFITCHEIPFTRIYFHWSGLLQKTVNFLELKKGDEVEFNAIEVEEHGVRAIKIDVFESKELIK